MQRDVLVPKQHGSVRVIVRIQCAKNRFDIEKFTKRLRTKQCRSCCELRRTAREVGAWMTLDTSAPLWAWVNASGSDRLSCLRVWRAVCKEHIHDQHQSRIRSRVRRVRLHGCCCASVLFFAPDDCAAVDVNRCSTSCLICDVFDFVRTHRDVDVCCCSLEVAQSWRCSSRNATECTDVFCRMIDKRL